MWSGYWAYKVRVSARLNAAGWLAAGVIGLQAISGTVLGLTGNRPVDSWHFLFGPLALVSLPLALSVARHRSQRAASLILFAGWFVTFALSLRAAGSGGFAA